MVLVNGCAWPCCGTRCPEYIVQRGLPYLAVHAFEASAVVINVIGGLVDIGLGVLEELIWSKRTGVLQSIAFFTDER